jgi:hypothetical protein
MLLFRVVNPTKLFVVVDLSLLVFSAAGNEFEVYLVLEVSLRVSTRNGKEDIWKVDHKRVIFLKLATLFLQHEFEATVNKSTKSKIQ